MTAPTILVVFHTAEGHTAQIADRVADVLRAGGAIVDVRSAEGRPSASGYAGVVLGDSIHMGHHSKALRRYALAEQPVLAAMPTALFQVSLSSANDDPGHREDAEGYLRVFVEETGISPSAVGLFAGALAYTRYGWVKRRMLRSIARRAGLDTDVRHDHVYTDWDAVDRFAEDVLAQVQGATRA
ncbi:MAG: flavodoxin domain-containing protein [Actinomycetes bacterium]